MKKQLIFSLIISSIITNSLSTDKPHKSEKKASLTVSATEAFNNSSGQKKHFKIKVGDTVTLKSGQYNGTQQAWYFSRLPFSSPFPPKGKKQAFENILNQSKTWEDQYGILHTQHTFKTLEKGTFEFYALSTQYPVMSENTYNWPQIEKFTLIVE